MRSVRTLSLLKIFEEALLLYTRKGQGVEKERMKIRIDSSIICFMKYKYVLPTTLLLLLSFHSLIYSDDAERVKADQHISAAKEMFKNKIYREAIIEAKKASSYMKQDGWYAYYVGELYYMSYHDAPAEIRMNSGANASI